MKTRLDQPVAILLMALWLAACAAKPTRLKVQPPPTTVVAVDCEGENARPAVECAHSPDVAFDPKGRLLLVWEQGGRVYVSHSADLGKTFSKPVAANPAAEQVADGEAVRPKIALSKMGAIYVAWTQGAGRPDAGEVRFSRSLDGGRTFAAPLSLGGGTAQAVVVNDRDYVYLAWVAGREAATELRFAYSSDGGRSFHAEKTITGSVSSDCGPAIKIEGKKFPVIVWQGATGHILTHFAAKEQPGLLLPFGEDACKDCPRHSPALAVGPQGEYYVAWAAGGVYFSASLGHGASFSSPVKISPTSGAGQPDVLVDGSLLYLAWTESNDQKTILREQYSTDSGLSWSSPLSLAEAAGKTGQPTLLAYEGRHFAAWQTRERGFKLIALD